MDAARSNEIMRQHYAIFWTHPLDGRPVWCRCTNRRRARQHARAVAGYVVSMTYGHRSAWDAPTFRSSGDVIADYRPAPEVKP
jgi:hypothetical protein